jgi:hypothetical protein
VIATQSREPLKRKLPPSLRDRQPAGRKRIRPLIVELAFQLVPIGGRLHRRVEKRPRACPVDPRRNAKFLHLTDPRPLNSDAILPPRVATCCPTCCLCCLACCLFSHLQQFAATQRNINKKPAEALFKHLSGHLEGEPTTGLEPVTYRLRIKIQLLKINDLQIRCLSVASY